MTLWFTVLAYAIRRMEIVENLRRAVNRQVCGGAHQQIQAVFWKEEKMKKFFSAKSWKKHTFLLRLIVWISFSLSPFSISSLQSCYHSVIILNKHIPMNNFAYQGSCSCGQNSSTTWVKCKQIICAALGLTKKNIFNISINNVSHHSGI